MSGIPSPGAERGPVAGTAQVPGAADLPFSLRGQQNVVMFDQVLGVTWRYPRTQAGVARLADVERRWRAVNQFDLLAPTLLDALVDAPLGQSHLTFALVPGSHRELGPGKVLDVAPGEPRRRLGRDLAAVLLRMREIPDGAWPLPSGWVALWDDMAAQVRTDVLPLLTAPVARRAEHDLRAAQQAARARPCGLCHGDLTPGNLHVDQDTGELIAIFDWDDVMRGDVAGDVACALATLPPAVGEAMLAAEPSLAGELARFGAYSATWPLQLARYGVEHARPDLVVDGLSRYRGAGPGAVSTH